MAQDRLFNLDQDKDAKPDTNRHRPAKRRDGDAFKQILHRRGIGVDQLENQDKVRF